MNLTNQDLNHTNTMSVIRCICHDPNKVNTILYQTHCPLLKLRIFSQFETSYKLWLYALVIYFVYILWLYTLVI